MKEEKFSFDTINNFDEHINLSIPGYADLMGHVMNISTYFIKENCTMYDLGASTGKMIDQMREHNKDIDCEYIGLDVCDNLGSKSSSVIHADLTTFKPEPFKFATSIFTLQFIPIEYRQEILNRFSEALLDHGAMIVAEKLYMNDGFVQDVMNFTYYDYKLKNFKAKSIIEKQLDLRYIMRPLTSAENEEMFRKAGFTHIQPFWQNLQFRAWLLLK